MRLLEQFKPKGGCKNHIIEVFTLGFTFYFVVHNRLPTDIQDEAIPLILGGGDVMAAAETGSGKTGV